MNNGIVRIIDNGVVDMILRYVTIYLLTSTMAHKDTQEIREPAHSKSKQLQLYSLTTTM